VSWSLKPRVEHSDSIVSDTKSPPVTQETHPPAFQDVARKVLTLSAVLSHSPYESEAVRNFCIMAPVHWEEFILFVSRKLFYL